MRNLVKQNWPLIVSISVFLICSIYYIINILNLEHGHFIYYYDDTYIHMAMARNFAEHGVWGVTKYGFTSSSSSLLWTALLAFVYLLTGSNEVTPYVICILSSLLLLYVFFAVFKKEGIKNIFSLLALLLLMYSIYMPSLAATGLEHVTYALFTVLFFYYAAGVVSGSKNETKDIIIMILLSVSLPLIRYEGLVSVLLLSVLLLVQRKALLSVFTFLAGTVPIFIFGLISVSKGWPFVPISIVLRLSLEGTKTSWDFFQSVFYIISKCLTFLNISMLIAALAFFTAGIYYYKRHKREIAQIYLRDLLLILFFMVNAIIYLIFSNVNFTARYQGYLIAAAVFITPIIFFRNKRKLIKAENQTIRAITFVSGILVVMTLFFFYDFSSYRKLTETIQMSENIYEQQYQMAFFVNRFYRNEEIAVNDVGAIGYFNDIKITDLVGLADYKVLEMRRREFSANDLRFLANTRHIKIAIIYPTWFIIDEVNVIPLEWKKIGEWKIFNNKICGSDAVSFYAVDNNEKERLIKNLRLNSRYLPPGVKESGIYKETEN